MRELMNQDTLRGIVPSRYALPIMCLMPWFLLPIGCVHDTSPGAQGTELSPPLLPIVVDGKWGYISPNGKVVVNPQYEYASDFSAGCGRINRGGKYRMSVRGEEVLGGSWGLVDIYGVEFIPPVFAHIATFSENLAAITNEEGKVGYVNSNGQIVIAPQFSQAGPFHEHRAAVRVLVQGSAQHRDAWGYIGEDGKMVISPKYRYAGDFSEGRAVVSPLTWAGRKVQFIDVAGRSIGAKAYEDAYPFSDGLAAVRTDDKWGFIDRYGKVRVIPKFDSVRSFSNGLAVVVKNGRYGFVDRKGAIVVVPQYLGAVSFSEGLAAVQVAGRHEKWGYIDQVGRMVIDARFDFADMFRGGLAYVMVAGQGGFIDQGGRVVFAVEGSPGSFIGQLARVRMLNGGIGYVDRFGHWIYPPTPLTAPR